MPSERNSVSGPWRSSDLGESRETVARGGSAQRVRGNVETLEILVLRRDIL
jgi:hypothetical protein